MLDAARSFIKKRAPTNVQIWSRSCYQSVRRLLDPDLFYGISAKFDSRIHQTTAYTALDRYPAAFSMARNELDLKNDLRILSFGCSTGEEVATLRKYFPKAFIVGAELNERRLKSCRMKFHDPEIVFIKSTEKNIKDLGPFDAIFAMAVLQRTPHLVLQNQVRDISSIYPFTKFHDQLVKLDENLTRGGLLIIQNTQYRFSDSELYAAYEVCGTIDPVVLQPCFDRNGQIIEKERYNEILFRKI